MRRARAELHVGAKRFRQGECGNLYLSRFARLLRGLVLDATDTVSDEIVVGLEQVKDIVWDYGTCSGTVC